MTGSTFILCSMFALFTLAFTEAQRGATGAQAEGPAPLLLTPAIAQGPITDLSQGTSSAGAIVSTAPRRFLPT